MAISYRKLRKLLKINNILMKELEKGTGISHGTLAKINKDEYIQLDKLELICDFLEQRIGKKISFNDIIERVSIQESERVEE